MTEVQQRRALAASLEKLAARAAFVAHELREIAGGPTTLEDDLADLLDIFSDVRAHARAYRMTNRNTTTNEATR